MNKRNFSKNKCLKMTAAFLFPFALFSGGMVATQTKSVAEENSDYVYNYHEEISLTNSDFTQGSKPSLKGDSLSGWTAIETDSRATGMLIDVGSGVNTEEGNNETETFSKNKENYMLNNNPGSIGSSSDSRILMINSKEKLSQKNIPAYKGFRSAEVKLEKNSYYRFSVSAYAMLNGDDYVRASIYLSGIKNQDGEDVELGYENITSANWKEYFFFVATGDKEQTVTLDLYLGTRTAERSEGAVFFDNANIMKYSENEFFDLCKNFGYKNNDVYNNYNEETTKFLVQTLKTKANIVEGTDSINLDFEDEIPENSNTLGEYWNLSSSDKSNASARVVNIRDMQPVDFFNMTGYGYTGDDLSYNNKQSLVLWTNNNEYSSSYIGVKSDDIAINAHNVYKVSLKMKIAGLESGNFYVKVSESDAIYNLYPTLLSSDKEAKNYYQLASQKTSGVTANVDNNWTNDYQTIEFYVKGHSVYNSFINLEFWLGDFESSAQGCVVIDNVQIEYANYREFSNASNKLELNSFSGKTDNISNPYFNNAEMSDKNTYPLTASNWTAVKGEEDYNESGIVYIGSEEEYKDMYKGKYDWAGIRPSTNSSSAMANNVYMMFNRKDSYQSLTSSAYALANTNDYYVLSFDYYNQEFGSLTPPSIKVEVIDENGIILFSEANISKLNAWETMNVYFHLPKTVSHNVQVKVSLGEKDNKVGGLVYLDNFDISVSDETAYNNSVYKSDLTNYYFNLSTEGKVGKEVSSSPAYTLEVDEVYNTSYTSENCGAEGGIVSGQENVYGVTNEENFLVITNRVASKASLKSNYKVQLEADKYYLLTFDLATIFDIEAENASNDDHDCKYGVSIKIDGFEAVSKLTASELKNFKIYYKSTSATSSAIQFSLVSDCDKTLGTALITNFDFVEANAEAYNSAKDQAGYNSSVFTSTVENVVDEPETPEEDTSPDDKENANGLDTALVLASSLIMGLALIIAIVGFILRKFKIKKIEKVKKESYDRKLNKNHDAILVEAQNRRDAEVRKLQTAKANLEQERLDMENAHKEYVRENRKDKLSRDIEKALKKYNADMARMNEKINILKEKIDYVMTAEYLLSIQRKVMMEEDEKLAKERKARKQALKAKLDEEIDQ